MSTDHKQQNEAIESADQHDVSKQQDRFPWHLGVYDSHCHPTDSMHAIPDLGKMKAQVLTIMATRFQDQDLVAQVANKYEYKLASGEEKDTNGDSPPGARIIPSFGYHPWFSHLIYDDLQNFSPSKPDKAAHYNKVLTSSPVEKDIIESLPEPTSLSEILQETRRNLEAHPYALLGEVGLDRTFRIPHGASWRSEDPDYEAKMIERAEGLTPGTHHSHRLTKHHVDHAHQIQILQAQLRLAGELNRAASVHVVGGQGVAFDAIRELWRGFELEVQSSRQRKMMKRKNGESEMVGAEDSDEEEEQDRPTTIKPFPPRICLHSFSGPPQTVQQYLHPSIPVEFYFSFSEVINFSLPEHQKRSEPEKKVEPSWDRALAALRTVPDDRLLIESDLHICGTRMDDLLEDIIRRVCEVRGWTLEDGAQRLKDNWHRFVFGSTNK